MSALEASPPIDPRTRRAGHLGGLVWIALGLAALAFAYFWTFCQFSEYDDEGYLMLTVRHMLDGRRLYDDVDVPYGPVYYAWRWLLHGPCAVPLGNDAVRIVSIATWIATAALYALLARRACPRSGFPLGAMAAAFAFAALQLRDVAYEPGHPQELSAAIAALAILLAAQLFARKPTLAFVVLGAASCALLLVKVNVGVFFGVAAGAVLGVRAFTRTDGRLASLAFALALALLPVALMRAHLAEAWAQNLCAVSTLGIAASLITLASARLDASAVLRPLLAMLAGALIVAVLAALFLLARGTSLAAPVQSLFVAPLRFPSAFKLATTTPRAAVVCAVTAFIVSMACALARGSRRERLLAQLVPLLKAGFIALALSGLQQAETLVDWAGPWLFLAAIPPALPAAGESELFARRLVVLVCGFAVLQSYPVAGSQMAIATAPLAVILALCIGDVWIALAIALGAVRAARLRAPTSAVLALAALALVIVKAIATRDYYQHNDAVDFPGCKLTRLPEEEALTLRFLADNVRESSDGFLSVVGSNSLYFWSGKEPVSDVVVSHAWDLFDTAQQERLIDGCRAHPALVVIDHPGLIAKIARAEKPFFEYLRRELRPRGRVGRYTLLVVKDRADPPLLSCATRVRSGSSGSPPLAPAIEAALADTKVQVWRLALPRGARAAGVAAVGVIDLSSGAALGFTAAADPRSRSRLLDLEGRTLLPLADPHASIAVSAGEELYLALPDHPRLQRAGLAAVDFLDDRERRLLSLPLASEPPGR